MTKGLRRSKGELTLESQLQENKIPYQAEYRFCNRKWRFDFLIGTDLAVEVEGGTWGGGRHTRGSGFASDCEKYNTAVLMGYRVLRFPTDQVLNGTAIHLIKQAVAESACI